MGNNIDIFENATPQSGEFFKFKNVGDSIQGTYIDVHDGTDSFGNEQTIYMIQDSDGKIWNVAFRKASLYVHERMAGIKFGQIVGYRFDEERESKKMPGTKAKIIRIYADNKFVNHEWLARQKELEINYKEGESTGVAPVVAKPVISDSGENPELSEGAIDKMFEAPKDVIAAVESMPTETEKPKSEALDAIRTLAKTKGLTNETMTEAEADAVIEKYTELKMEDSNMTKIIIGLTGYTKQ